MAMESGKRRRTAKDQNSIAGADGGHDDETGSDSEQDNDHEHGTVAGARRRIVRACDLCRRKRVKCTGETPCEKCVAANKAHLCVYSPYQQSVDALVKQERDAASPLSSKKRFEMLERRVAALESSISHANKSSFIYSECPAGYAAQPQQPPPRLDQLAGQPIAASALSVESAVDGFQAVTKDAIPSTPSMDTASQSKSGGFVINAEENRLLFFGSTSSLGGPKDDKNPWKSNPRFRNGILLGYNPAAVAQNTATKQETVEETLAKCKHCSGEGVVKPITLFDLVPLPDELLDHILSIFWEQMHPQFPMVERSWFENQLESLRKLPHFHIDDHWQFALLLTSVLSLMINSTPSVNHWKSYNKSSTAQLSDINDFKDHDAVLKHMMDSYRRIMLDHFGIPDMIVIQSLVFNVLTVATGIASKYYQGSWSYMGIAVRLSQELGLHRSIHSLGVKHRVFTPDYIALRNRTWHCVMIMETYTGIWTGRPLGIHDNDWDAEYPEGTTPEIATLKHHIDLSLIIASILRFANRARPADVKIFAEEIKSRLDAWWMGLDEPWRNLTFSERWNAKSVMALMFHSTVILFHRTAYNRIDYPACLESAAAITRVISRLENPAADNEATVLFPNFMYCTMMGVTVLISQLLASDRNSSEGKARFEWSVNGLEKCMRILDIMRRNYVSAERSWVTICDFLAAKGIRLDELFDSVKQHGGATGTGTTSAGGPFSGTGGPSLTAGGGVPSNAGFVQNLNSNVPSVSSMGTGVSPDSWHATSNFTNSSLFGNGAVSGGPFEFSMGQGLGINDLSLWDGLSFFDLAGLGGLANTDFLYLSQPQPQPLPSSQQQQRMSLQRQDAPMSHVGPSVFQSFGPPHAPSLPSSSASLRIPGPLSQSGVRSELSSLHQLAEISIGKGGYAGGGPASAGMFPTPVAQPFMGIPGHVATNDRRLG
ncbi:hypothetical protein BJ741DRAFT_593652 [Chytriomyces cf. hyalinus JEL632]|nr:hypothetical protein BJ741DRAFT_593652 [Chytriomyces cf. hyalinus JEL632]